MLATFSCIFCFNEISNIYNILYLHEYWTVSRYDIDTASFQWIVAHILPLSLENLRNHVNAKLRLHATVK